MAPNTACYWVIDDSGSMSGFQAEVRRAVQGVVDRSKSTDVTHTFVCFSNGAIVGNDLSDIHFACGGTEIAQGFDALNRKMLASVPLPPKVLIVFISDGEDNNSGTIVERLKALGGSIQFPGLASVLFTVAVGDYFPTNMVVDALRPNYHNASDYLPLVFPLDEPHEASEVFGQLEQYMFRCDHMRAGPPEYGPDSSQAELEGAAKAIYNYAVVKASRERDNAQVCELLKSAKEQLEHVAAVLNEREAKLAGELGPAKKVESLKPLVSRQITKYKKERASGLTLVRSLQEKLNVMCNDAVAGRVLSRLGDAELAKALGYGNNAGKHFAKAYKYHSAEFSISLSSLVAYLLSYGSPAQRAADAQVCDYVMSQEEAFLDARECADDLKHSTLESIVSLCDVLPVVGRLVAVKTSDGVQINPWLVSVTGLPHVMRVMNTVDFFTRHNGAYEDAGRGETANCVLPITTHADNVLRQQVGQHLATFMLCRNEALCFPQALASLIAAVAVFCLDHPQPLPSWVQDELSQVLTTYTHVYTPADNLPTPAGLGKGYLARLVSSDLSQARRCLVTEDPSDENGVKCEHLTKWILGLCLASWRATQPGAGKGQGDKTEQLSRHWSSAELRQLLVWTLVEAVGRAVDRSKPATAVLGPAPAMQHTPAEVLSQVPTDSALACLTLPQAVDAFTSLARVTITPAHPLVGLVASGPEELLAHHVPELPVQHYQFSEASLTRMFTSLDRLAGNNAPDGYFTLTPAERLSVLVTAHTHASSVERCTAPLVAFTGLDLAREVTSAWVREVVGPLATDHITCLYTAQSLRVHTQAPLRHVPRAFAARYLLETGRDVESDLVVHPETRLSRVACMSPGCPHFLHRQPPAFADDGRPRISDHVLNHLAPASLRPAYTRTLVTRLDQAPQDVAQAVLAGAALLPCEEKIRERAVAAVSRWWSSARAAGGAQGELSEQVAADMAVFRDAEAQWGGYGEFKRLVDARVYGLGEGLME